jgi:tape measure domain-containing protein
VAKTEIDQMAVVVSASTDGLASDLRRAAGMVDRFSKEVGRASDGIRPAGLDVGRLNKDSMLVGMMMKKTADESRSTFAAISSGMTSLASKTLATAGGMVAAEAGVAGLTGAFNALKDSVVKAGDLEQTTLAFETMLKSGTAATQMIGDIRKYAATTPFNTNELTQSARGLLAYGVAADQIMPTIKMLGDVSATFGKDLPMSRLSYLYGTLFAQQRAFTKDVNQFAGAGVPIYDELSKVMGKSVSEIRDMTEEGRIGRDEITKAFVSMTAAGGRFEGMTARQADSIHGTWEAMSDAFDLAKVKLGQVIVKGLGLKDMFRDAGSFAEQLTAGMDRLEPAINFTGKLARAGANFGWEFAKSIPKIGDIIVQQVDASLPEVRKSFNDFKAIIEDATQFKLDPEKVVNFGVSAGEAMLEIGIEATRFIGDASKAFKEGFLNPLLDTFEAVRDLVGGIKGVGRAANFFNPFREENIKGVDELRFDFKYPTKDMKPGEILKNYDILRGHRSYLEDLPDGHVFKSFNLKAVKEAQERFSGHFANPDAARKQLDQGFWPDENAVSGRRGFGEFDFGGMARSMEQRKADLRAVGRGLNEKAAHDAKMARWDAIIGPDVQGRIAELNRKRDRIKANREGEFSPLFELGGAFGNPLAATAMAGPNLHRIDARERAKQAMGMVPGPLGAPFRPQVGDGVRLMNDFPQHLIDLEKSLKAEYRPLNVGPNVKNMDDALKGTQLGKERDDLTALLKAGRIDQAMFDKAWGGAVGKVAERMGVGTYRLPDAAMKDSVESVRLLNQWQNGQGSRSVESLLQQIHETLKAGNRNTERTAEQLPDIAPMPHPLGGA